MKCTSLNSSGNNTIYGSWYHDIENILYDKVILTICIFGILGNVMNLAVLTHKSVISHMDRMEKSAHLGLVALAVSDLLFCISAVPNSFENRQQFDYESVTFELWYRVYGHCIVNMFIMSSTWLTVVMAMCRYLAICFPIRGRQLLGKTFTSFSISAVFVLCIIFNLPRFWMHEIDHIECAEGWPAYYQSPGSLARNAHLEQAYMWLFCFLCIVIPLILLAYCNVYLIQALRSSNQLRQQHSRSHDTAASRNHTLTLILTVIVIFCICLVTPAEFLNFTKSYITSSPQFEASDQFNLAVAVCNTLQAINFAFNFVLYCVVNVHFRQSLKLLCGWRKADARALQVTWTAKHYVYASTSAEELDTVALNTCSTRL